MGGKGARRGGLVLKERRRLFLFSHPHLPFFSLMYSPPIHVHVDVHVHADVDVEFKSSSLSSLFSLLSSLFFLSPSLSLPFPFARSPPPKKREDKKKKEEKKRC